MFTSYYVVPDNFSKLETLTMAEMFVGAKLKVEWAAKHIQNVEHNLLEFMDRGAGVRIVKTIEYNVRTGHPGVGLYLETDPVPPFIGLLLGDVLHNLRAALDYVAWELVETAGGQPGTKTYFPIAETAAKSEELTAKGGLKIAGPEVCDVLLNVIKPFKGGNQNLWALHSVNNTDKHRLTVPTVAVTKLTGFSAHATRLTIANNTMSVSSGARGAIIGGCPSDIVVDNVGIPTFEASFPPESEFGGTPLVPKLKELVDTVRQTIDAVEAAYKAARG